MACWKSRLLLYYRVETRPPAKVSHEQHREPVDERSIRARVVTARRLSEVRTIWWLGPLQLTAWGENWHKNHHANSGSARLGLRWWQPDIGWYFIYALESVGLARNVKRPRERLSQISDISVPI